MEININNVTCFDLMPYNETEILELCQMLGLDPEATLFNKKNGVKKVYLIVDEMLEVASEISDNSPFSKTYCTFFGLKTEFPLSRRQIKQLRNLKPFNFREFKKQQRQEAHQQRILEKNKDNPTIYSEINLDLDTILDKILKSGITSLNRKEKEFLDNQSK